jgi:hypothetical protein
MRIAVVGQRDNPYRQNQVFGGVDTVEKNQVALFAHFSNDVHFITSLNSDALNVAASTHKVSQPSKFNPESEVDTRVRNSDIRRILVSIKPDLIVVHDSMTRGLARAIEGIAPTICYMHDVAGIFGLASINYVNEYIDLLDTCVVTGVSKNSNEEWNRFIDQTSLVEDKRHITDYHLTPIFWDYPSIAPLPYSVNDRMVGIGRLVEQKNFFRSVYVMKESKKDFHIFFPGIRDLGEQVLYDDLALENLFLHQGRPHSEIMDFLMNSAGLLVTGKESFGLTAFEANCRGVPVFLYTRGDHAVQEATCAYGLFQYSDRNEMRESMKLFRPLSYDHRVDIQKAMYDKFNALESYGRFLQLATKAKSIFESRNTLESFT